MLTTTHQSDPKEEKPAAFLVPDSRMSERYGEGSDGLSVGAQNDTTFKDVPKVRPELALVQISKVRVFKARE